MVQLHHVADVPSATATDYCYQPSGGLIVSIARSLIAQDATCGYNRLASQGITDEGL